MAGRPRYRIKVWRPDDNSTGGFRRLARVAILLILFSGCVHDHPESKDKGYLSRDTYPNLLDFSFIPGNVDDFGQKVFYDEGAWQGYSLPHQDSSQYWGSFIGPYLHDKKEWLANSILDVQIFEELKSDSMPESFRTDRIDFSKSDTVHIYSIPGRLRQELYVDSLHLEFDLVYSYTTNRTAAVFVKVTNLTPRKRFLTILAAGRIFEANYKITKKDSTGILVNTLSGKPVFALQWASGVNKKLNIKVDNYSYSIKNRAVFIVGKFKKMEAAFQLTHYPDTLDPDSLLNNTNIELLASNNHIRNYLKNLQLSADTNDIQLNRVAVKALQTLMMNHREGYGDLAGYSGTLPSASIGYFNGFWAWDSWKHVVALADIDLPMARTQLIDMMSFQNERGMIADCVFPDKSEDNWRDSKPPLAAWAAVRVFDEDTTGLAKLFPKLLKYHRWWYAERDHDENGLCEYGSIDGTLEAARWESGMDDAVRFDDSKMLQNGPQAWSINQESVDLNSYLYFEKKALARLAKVLGEQTLSDSLMADVAMLKERINTRFFDSESGYFYDVIVGSDEFVKVKGPEGWIPLWAGAASMKNAERVHKVLTDTSTFATYIPFPTVAKDEVGFMSGYWRGPVWLDQAYFAVAGLAKYGYSDDAQMFARQLLLRPEGISDERVSIRENYHPLTGEGLKVHNFSWSAAHLLLLRKGLVLGEWR
ncbi:MAG: MGH1-like glycoside hydrolase domain-containing protein [Calditrichia bacterium]